MARVMLVPIPNARMLSGIRLWAATDKKSRLLSNLDKKSAKNIDNAVCFIYLQWYFPSEKQYITTQPSNGTIWKSNKISTPKN